MTNMKTVLDGDESVVLLQKKSMWFEKKVQAFPGTLYATTRRVLFDQDELDTPPPGIMGKWFPKLKERHYGGVRVDLKLSDVEKVEKTTFGKGTYLHIHAKGHPKPLKFTVENYSDWEKLLSPNV